MMQYEKYKSSNIEWIGEIPSHWNIKKLKYVLSDKLKYGANESAEFEDEKDPRYIRITDFGGNGILRNDTFKSLPLEIAKEYLLQEGDILFARSGATVGKTFQFKNYSGVACYAGYLIKASPKEIQILSDFLYYFTKSNCYENWKDSIINKATIENIGADKYSLLEIPIPPTNEQTAIANFLDDKTIQIDKLIANKQKLIEFLTEERTAIINKAILKGIDQDVKLIPTGIKWLGDIPVHWELKPLKRAMILLTDYDANGSFSTIRDNVNRTNDLVNRFAWLVRATDLENSTQENNIESLIWVDKITYDFLSKSALFENDLLIAKRGEIGKVYLMPKFDYPATLGPNMYLARLDRKKLLSEFAYYYFLSDIGKSQLVLNNKSTTIGAIYKDDFKSILIVYPSLIEQDEIVKFIKTETQRIDTTISKIKKEIELMNEYKKALISEGVTGKIKVML